MASNDPKFSVLLLTAAPTHQAAEAGAAFVKIDGRESLLRAVELFLNREEVVQIQVVVSEENLEEVKRKHGPHFSFSGVKLLTGGPGWMDQIGAAAGKISAEATHVMVHDAARPVVPYTDIDALMGVAGGMVLPCMALTSLVRNMLVEVDGHGHPKGYQTPERYLNLLTPQLFMAARFNEMAKTKVEVPAGEVGAMKGSPLNMRCSGPGDAGLLKVMMSLLPKPKKKGLNNPFEEAQW